MKRAAAIILSLMFIGLQVMSPALFFSSASQAGRDCGCKKHDCCVAKSNTEAPPQPAAPTSPQQELSLLPLLAVSWTLPLSASSSAISADRLSPLASAVPLFTWHCTLLI